MTRITIYENPVAGFERYLAWITNSPAETQAILEAVKLLDFAEEIYTPEEVSGPLFHVNWDKDGDFTAYQFRTGEETLRLAAQAGMNASHLDELRAFIQAEDGDEALAFDPWEWFTITRANL